MGVNNFTIYSITGSDFVHSACWIQGFYIYRELKDRFDESGYYGIPTNIDNDGMTEEGKLCRTTIIGTGIDTIFPFILFLINFNKN